MIGEGKRVKECEQEQDRTCFADASSFDPSPPQKPPPMNSGGVCFFTDGTHAEIDAGRFFLLLFEALSNASN
jgi:hypothetical protein